MKDYDPSDMIERVATSVKKQFHEVDREDLVQELWLKWCSTDTSHMNEKMMWSTLRRAGVAWSTKERAHIVGYEPEDLFYYSTGQIQELLPVVMDRESWTTTTVVGERAETKPNSDPAHGNNRLAMICDVRSALEACSEADKRLLWTAFGLGVSNEEHALSFGITEDAMRMRIVRALRRLQKHLGGPDPAPRFQGGRRALSNSQAQAITRNQEDPE